MSKKSPLVIIQDAIAKADSSYFFENYTKQAQAVIDALGKAGFTLVPGNFPDSVWKQVADEMKTGRIKPEEHTKDVYLTALRVISQQK